MNCPRLESLLSDYLEGVLSPPVRQAVDEHLGGCGKCSALIEDVSGLCRDLNDFPQVIPTEDSKRGILLATAGIPQQRTLWRDLLLPTIQPFMTQRFAFATAMMFVFLSLMVNLMGPGFSTLSYSDLSPSSLAEGGARVMSEVSKKWNQFREARARFFEELSLMAEDLSGRIDYHVISSIFENVHEQDEASSKEVPSPEGTQPEGDPGDKSGSRPNPEEPRQ